MARSREWRRWRSEVVLHRVLGREIGRVRDASHYWNDEVLPWQRRVAPGMDRELAFEHRLICDEGELLAYAYDRARKYRDNPKVCSCPVCGNPSRFGKGAHVHPIATRKANQAWTSFEKALEEG